MERKSQRSHAPKAHDCWLFSFYDGGVVKLANTPDFQSGILTGICGFDSHRRHQKGGQSDETATMTP
jgi:hypothetical protein